MSLIKLGLDGMPIPDKIQFARQIAQAMQGNTAFPTPTPTRPEYPQWTRS